SDLSVSATCVRLPFFTSHAESVYFEVDKAGLTKEDIWDALQHAEGVVIQDNPKTQTYPPPLNATDKEDDFIGRVRQDHDNEIGFNLWVVSDNFIKGAAFNTVQNAESIIRYHLF